MGRKVSGGKVEALLFESKKEDSLWKGLFKPGERLHVGTEIHFNSDNYGVIEKEKLIKDGTMTMRWHGKDSVIEFYAK